MHRRHAYTFLKVMNNMPIGKSLFDKNGAELSPKLVAKAKAKGCELQPGRLEVRPGLLQ